MGWPRRSPRHEARPALSFQPKHTVSPSFILSTHPPPPIPSPKRIPRLTSFIHTHTHSHARTHTCITTTRFTPDYVGGMNMIESVLPWSSLTRFPHKSFDGMDRWMDRWMMGGMAFHREIQVCMYTSIPNVLFVLLSLYGTFCFLFFSYDFSPSTLYTYDPPSRYHYNYHHHHCWTDPCTCLSLSSQTRERKKKPSRGLFISFKFLVKGKNQVIDG